jgi:hypothetical protein
MRVNDHSAKQSAEVPVRDATMLQTAKAVLWSFFGVRRRAAYEQDALRLKPLHVIFAGLIAAALFVLVLIAVVRIVVN